MSHRPLHIVCLDAPAPPDYGGAIDMYYKIRALAESGRSITLHYFDYRGGRSASGLEPYCTAIHRYPRKSFLSSIWEKQPYIVGSRNNGELLRRLQLDDAPILLEGIHCTGMLPHLYGKRKILVRMHNDEAAYYDALAENEASPIKKLYYRAESRLLGQYQRTLPKELPLACVVHHDIELLARSYGFTNLPFIPSFTPWQQVSGVDGRGGYCLYQGNLAVNENLAAATWLVENVFAQLKIPLVIAGSRAPQRLGQLVAAYPHISVRSDLSNADMEQLVRDAQINILPSFNTTGLKLKMLHALFQGRHCITNRAAVEGTAFSGCVELAETPGEFRAAVERLWEQPYGQEERSRRIPAAEVYSNRRNAATINAWL